MRVPGIASFRFGASDGQALAIAEPDARPDLVEDAYHRAILPMALHAHGTEVLHGSGVLMPAGVVAICARSQTGKSTLAYALHRKGGYRVWADDAVAFKTFDDRVEALPFPHRLRIRPDAASFFGLDADQSLAFTQTQSTPAPLACIFVLERDDELKQPVTFRLGPGKAFSELFPHAYWFSLQDLTKKRETMNNYLALCTQIPIFQLRFMGAMDELPAMLDQIESSVKAIHSNSR